MMSHDWYESIGQHYFDLATKKGQLGVLPAVKKCFAIAGSNLKQIIDITPDPSRKSELTTKLLKTLNFAEELNKKILSDPSKYDVQ